MCVRTNKALRPPVAEAFFWLSGGKGKGSAGYSSRDGESLGSTQGETMGCCHTAGLQQNHQDRLRTSGHMSVAGCSCEGAY